MSLLQSVVLLTSVLVKEHLQHGLRVKSYRFQENPLWISLVLWSLHFKVVLLLLLLKLGMIEFFDRRGGGEYVVGGGKGGRW